MLYVSVFGYNGHRMIKSTSDYSKVVNYSLKNNLNFVCIHILNIASKTLANKADWISKILRI